MTRPQMPVKLPEGLTAAGKGSLFFPCRGVRWQRCLCYRRAVCNCSILGPCCKNWGLNHLPSSLAVQCWPHPWSRNPPPVARLSPCPSLQTLEAASAGEQSQEPELDLLGTLGVKGPAQALPVWGCLVLQLNQPPTASTALMVPKPALLWGRFSKSLFQ